MSNEMSTPAVISDSTINANKVGALADRPTSPSGYGGHGLTSDELRRRFDNLPKLAIEALNNLILFMSAGGDSEAENFFTFTGAAPVDSPALTGTPTAPSPNAEDGSTKIATTAWVRNLVERYETLYLAILEGRDGNVPSGGSTGLVLSKRSDDDFDVEWASLSDFAFGSPTAVTPQTGDNSTKVATTAFVAAAVSAMRTALLGGAGEAYDTLKELADALGAMDDDVAGALSLIASKENKTTFVYVTPGANNEVEIAVLSDHDYRPASFEVTSLSLTFPLTPGDGFIASFSFSTPDDADITLSYTNMPDSYATGDDCAGGVFVPARGATYTVVVWYEEYPAKYQWVVRKSG